jgi:hypothetical protein
MRLVGPSVDVLGTKKHCAKTSSDREDPVEKSFIGVGMVCIQKSLETARRWYFLFFFKTGCMHVDHQYEGDE